MNVRTPCIPNYKAGNCLPASLLGVDQVGAGISRYEEMNSRSHSAKYARVQDLQLEQGRVVNKRQ